MYHPLVATAFRWIRHEVQANVRLVVTRYALSAVWMTVLSGCVIGRTTRPSVTESAQGPLAAPVTGSPVVPQTAPEDGDGPPDKPKPGATWVRGYWHWDGVRYVWQRGRWQDEGPAPRDAAQ
jgi:hypothetical protein